MKISKEKALEFKNRWRIVNEIQRKEPQKLSPLKKLHQLKILMKWAKDFGWIETLKSEELAVRKRWIKLKKLYHA
ncbi:MAG: hypothetical protein AB1498_00635 [bacterium]